MRECLSIPGQMPKEVIYKNKFGDKKNSRYEIITFLIYVTVRFDFNISYYHNIWVILNFSKTINFLELITFKLWLN